MPDRSGAGSGEGRGGVRGAGMAGYMLYWYLTAMDRLYLWP